MGVPSRRSKRTPCSGQEMKQPRMRPPSKLSLLMRAPIFHCVELSRRATNQHLATVNGHSATVVVCKLGVSEGGMKIRHTSLLFVEMLRAK